MATPKKTATPKPALPYDKKLVTAWKNVGKKAAAGRYPSLREVEGQPGTREAFGAAYDAGGFPAAALWSAGSDAAALAPARMAAEVLATRPAQERSLFFVYLKVSLLLARRLREDPTALDAFAAGAGDLDRALVDVARAEATAPADGAPAATRALLAREWAGTSANFPALVAEGGDVVSVRLPFEAWRAATDDTARRIFGPHLAADLAAAHRAQLAAHSNVAGAPGANPLSAREEPLRLAAPALTPEEVCGFQSRFPALQALAAGWGVDDLARAGDAVVARDRPGAALTANSLAVLAIARHPGCAPRFERHLSLPDPKHDPSPPTAFTLDALLRAPAAWRRRYALDLAFAPGAPPSSLRGPVALVLLASVDPEAAERVAAERAGEIDTFHIIGVEPAALLPLLDGAGPALRRALLLPIFAGSYPGAELPTSLDDLFAFDGTYGGSRAVSFLRALPEARAVAIVRREIAAGRAELARFFLAGSPVLAAAEG